LLVVVAGVESVIAASSTAAESPPVAPISVALSAGLASP